jgi:Ca-activated chloride channel family protein
VILEHEDLALTPMVFVIWRDRYERFAARFARLDFQNLSTAMAASGGWGELGGRPEWGLFKFSHTDPEKSNSGLLMLVMLAYELSGKDRGLTLADLTTTEFQGRLGRFVAGATRPGGVLTHSTGTMMKEMTLRGPSQYDCVMTYENAAIGALADARTRWGPLQVVYPSPTIWNENPYYVLDVPWSGPEQRSAARAFLAFLLSEPMQVKAMSFGFRPGNPKVAMNGPESPFVTNAESGVQLEVPNAAEPPKADVVDTLMTSYRRAQ